MLQSTYTSRVFDTALCFLFALSPVVRYGRPWRRPSRTPAWCSCATTPASGWGHATRHATPRALKSRCSLSVRGAGDRPLNTPCTRHHRGLQAASHAACVQRAARAYALSRAQSSSDTPAPLFLFLSPGYKNSEPCRSEAEYARVCKKDVVPVLFETKCDRTAPRCGARVTLIYIYIQRGTTARAEPCPRF